MSTESSEKIVCVCGSNILAKNKAVHEKTKKHLAFCGGVVVVPEKKIVYLKQDQGDVLGGKNEVSNDGESDGESEDGDGFDDVLDAIEKLDERNELRHQSQLELLEQIFDTLGVEEEMPSEAERKKD